MEGTISIKIVLEAQTRIPERAFGLHFSLFVEWSNLRYEDPNTLFLFYEQLEKEQQFTLLATI